jgi:hypothetical protein
VAQHNNPRNEARKPVWDPTVGVSNVNIKVESEPPHRLVTIGDSLTHGFQSGAVFRTDVSYPAIVAYELGCLEQFRYPTYDGVGGLPLNIELLLRTLEERFGITLNWYETPLALFDIRQYMDRVEDYWERGPGAVAPQIKSINHNLAVYGWDLRDALNRTGNSCKKNIEQPKDDLLDQFIENSAERAAMRVYPITNAARDMTLFDAAAELGNDLDDAEAGIETLVVFLGSNNALRSVIDLQVTWSEDDGYKDLNTKRRYTVWRSNHFENELGEVADRVRNIKALHVIWCTVPHVTIAPIARGIGGKLQPGYRYFPYYTRPWITDSQFDPRRDPHITAEEAYDIDSAIDGYNNAITKLVHDTRSDPNDPRDWYLLDIAGLLDRLAQRRYIDDPLARPSWWQPYTLPAALRALTPPLSSRFLTSDGHGRATGGLFSLDGVHPTTVGYGLIAQELINVMRQAGVIFRYRDRTPRPDPVLVDFDRLIRRDTLVNTPPGIINSSLDVMAWADELLNFVRRALSFAF